MEALMILGFEKQDTYDLQEKLEKIVSSWIQQDEEKRKEERIDKIYKKQRKSRRTPNERDITGIKRRLEGLVISERDKNASKLYV